MASKSSNEIIDDSYQDILAFIKYEGELVDEGYLDARKSADVMYGVDEVIKFFLMQEDPSIKGTEIEIPIRMRRGSWELLVPENIDWLLVRGVIYWSAAKYAGSALGEMAKNDFKEIGLKELFRKAIQSMVNVVRIGKHLGTTKKRKFENVKFSEDQKLIGIPDENGKLLWIPKEYIDSYVYCPDNIFSKIVNIVENKREVSIGVYDASRKLIQENITTEYKNIFTQSTEDDNDEVLFPELKHGDYVELEGHITRGNEKANTIGFLYQGHILTCSPNTGNVKDHKSVLFTNALLKGFIDRESIDGNFIEKRPRIKYNKISQGKRSNKQRDIF